MRVSSLARFQHLLTFYCSATGIFYAKKSSFTDAEKDFSIQAVDLQHPIIEIADLGSGKFVATLDTSRGAANAAAVLTLNSEGEVGDGHCVEIMSNETQAANK